jgi:hypothetical protein
MAGDVLQSALVAGSGVCDNSVAWGGAGAGGLLVAGNATMIICDSSIIRNTAYGAGGAIAVLEYGRVVAFNTTIANNTCAEKPMILAGAPLSRLECVAHFTMTAESFTITYCCCYCAHWLVYDWQSHTNQTHGHNHPNCWQ